MIALLKTSMGLLAFITPLVIIAGCGSDEPAPIAASPEEPLKLGDDSPLDQLGADPGQD
jgi:hypothetical protein